MIFSTKEIKFYESNKEGRKHRRVKDSRTVDTNNREKDENTTNKNYDANGLLLDAGANNSYSSNLNSKGTTPTKYYNNRRKFQAAQSKRFKEDS
jgi:hypothetical protein